MATGFVVAALSATLIAVPAFADSGLDYVALGDSYSSGVGAPGATTACLQSPLGYPALFADAADVTSFTQVACGGAKTADVLAGQLDALSPQTDVVSLTIGGNDVGFAPTLGTCLFGDDTQCAQVVEATGTNELVTVGANLDRTYAAIRERAPDAKVIVLGYPRLFEETPDCGFGGLSLAKRQVLNAGADRLAEQVAARVGAAGPAFTYVDVRGAFVGHGICGADPWLNNASLLALVDSFHPNAEGYAQGYLPTLSAVVDAVT
jgi:lysophospholipase L1-like esterase